ncbi:hypothetical protein Tco_1310628 [Tanacetum coccineum]
MGWETQRFTFLRVLPGISSSGDGVGPVAQRIRARGYEPRCRGFESLLAHNRPKRPNKGRAFPSGGRKIMIGIGTSSILMHEDNQFGQLWVGLYYGFLTPHLHRTLLSLPSPSSRYGRRNREEGISNNWFYYGTAHNVHIDLLCASASSTG